MILEPIYPKILSVRRLHNAHPSLLEAYGADPSKHSSLGLITCDQDDSTYVALDEATKHSPVDVVYAKSFYAGAAHASGRLSGEILGVIAGANPDEIEEGLKAAIRCLDHDACFYTADADGTIAVFPHVISSLGYYLSEQAGLKFGDSMAYLVAPPMEASIALDAALKAADVRAAKIFPPPTETNFAAAWLTGELPECQAAAEAFAEMVVRVGMNAIEQLG
ncbi:ethanolamine utilization microcompartment protein EutL [Microvenator marinus]|jgi:ethanolamine utilization protein EutL|uniref:Ethanolamine utilization microcompartment protein EutL n=1 Tax=Microvenator marinus TaxID=2600177 RepID=A0A5B8XW37_9DELT|nr:ethanolamine utilization microcompartment protein EutL [Microvenator marinus]QED30122.1 ethanolamine utilization microcompartment protein EutL [Microvenator marinus]